MKISMFGSSLLSAYWNGAATYYRGMIRALSDRGHDITFYEPDAYDRQSHRDIDPPSWAECVVYSPDENSAKEQLLAASDSDLVIKASGVGVLDEFLEREVLNLRSQKTKVIFWDVDAPATLDRLESNPGDSFRALVPEYDCILTYGGGNPVVEGYKKVGARNCLPIYNAMDPATHHPVAAEAPFISDLSFLGNRLPDRETRVEDFFLQPAESLPDKKFLLGGSGWDDKPVSRNTRKVGHVFTDRHNVWNCSAGMVLNISRTSMAKYGFSPATRVFEAAAAGACLISDAWEGIEEFFEPCSEILVAESGDDVAELVLTTPPKTAREIGWKALRRALGQHTYAHRARQFERHFNMGLSQ